MSEGQIKTIIKIVAVLFVGVVVAIPMILILLPTVTILVVIFGILAGILAAVLTILTIVLFLWYAFREEPSQAASTSYSLSQSKEKESID